MSNGEVQEVLRAIDSLVKDLSIEEAIERMEEVIDYAEVIVVGLEEDMRRSENGGRRDDRE